MHVQGTALHKVGLLTHKPDHKKVEGVVAAETKKLEDGRSDTLKACKPCPLSKSCLHTCLFHMQDSCMLQMLDCAACHLVAVQASLQPSASLQA